LYFAPSPNWEFFITGLKEELSAKSSLALSRRNLALALSGKPQLPLSGVNSDLFSRFRGLSAVAC
jgi:hypothetical protein